MYQWTINQIFDKTCPQSCSDTHVYENNSLNKHMDRAYGLSLVDDLYVPLLQSILRNVYIYTIFPL